MLAAFNQETGFFHLRIKLFQISGNYFTADAQLTPEFLFCHLLVFEREFKYRCNMRESYSSTFLVGDDSKRQFCVKQLASNKEAN